MTVVAIHQPNYLPWLGYFAKMATADIFIFLDDVQYSKGSYTNRVRILRAGEPRWLTMPVVFNFGDTIREVQCADAGWQSRHIDILSDFYRQTKCFTDIMPEIALIIKSAPAEGSISTINRHLVQAFAARLSLGCKLLCSSEIPATGLKSDDRLIELTLAVASQATYLSGQGGSAYQDAGKFAAAGITLKYIRFKHPTYDQGIGDFVPGMSIVDALFHLGWDGVKALLPKKSVQ